MTETTDQLLDELRHIGETESVKHVWKEGEYQGCEVTYTNPLLPELKTIFHPYIPLMITKALQPGVTSISEPRPKLTRQYLLERGLSVPGESKRVN